MNYRDDPLGAVGTGKSPVPETGIIPPRPENFRYDEATSRLMWDAVSTDKCSKFHVYWSNAPTNSDDARTNADWDVVNGSPVTNAGSDNTLELVDQVSDSWFVVIPESSTLGLFGWAAGPIQNRRPARVCDVKGYTLNNYDLTDENVYPGDKIRIKITLSITGKSTTLTGHQTYFAKTLDIIPERQTGFWHAPLLQGQAYNFQFFYDNDSTDTETKTIPSLDEVFYDAI